jgi:AraC-like DNA-binding protein
VGHRSEPPSRREPAPASEGRYHWFTPRPERASWLARLWVQEAPAAEAPPTTVVPHGQVELIVCYGDPFVHIEGGQARGLPSVMALGQRTRPIEVAATGETGLVIAGLHPWAGEALLGAETESLTDQMVDLAELVGRPRVATLADRVASAAGPEERARSVEEFLGGLFRHAPDALAVACARRVSQRGGDVSIDSLARELGVGGRHLRRRVTGAVGIGPKRLARLVRAQRALTGVRSGLAGAEVARRCGYVDQAHLTRELKAFTGRTPGCLARAEHETPLMRSFNRRGASPQFDTVYL